MALVRSYKLLYLEIHVVHVTYKVIFYDRNYHVPLSNSRQTNMIRYALSGHSLIPGESITRTHRKHTDKHQ